MKVAAALESLGPHEAVEGFRRTEEGFMNGFSAFASQPPTKGWWASASSLAPQGGLANLLRQLRSVSAPLGAPGAGARLLSQLGSRSYTPGIPPAKMLHPTGANEETALQLSGHQLSETSCRRVAVEGLLQRRPHCPCLRRCQQPGSSSVAPETL